MLELGHVILVTPDLDGTKWRFEDLGFTVVDGGRHPGLGTANCVIPLRGRYLELLGVADEKEAAANTFGQSVLRAAQEGEHLVRWALQTDEIDVVAAEAKVPVEFRSRIAPNGELLTWRAAGLRQAVEQPCRPFFVQWDDPRQYPGTISVEHANGATSIDELVIATSEPAAIQKWIDRSGAPVRVIPGPCLVALAAIGGSAGTVITIPDTASSAGVPLPRQSPVATAEAIAARLPQRSFMGSFGHSVPSRAAFDRARCPRCGRRIGFPLERFASGGDASTGFQRTEAELVAACVADGPRRRYAELFSPDEIVDAAAVIGRALGERGWKKWAHAFSEAVELPETSTKIETVGLTLDALRGFGPLAVPANAPAARDRPDDPRTLTERDLNVLVASSAPHWPTSG